MTLNLAHALTQTIISWKLQGEPAPTDKDTAKIARCTTRTVRRHRSNYPAYSSTKAPSNGAGRPSTITPVMIAALHDRLASYSNMCLREEEEFEVELTRFSIRRALKRMPTSQKKIPRTSQKNRAYR